MINANLSLSSFIHIVFQLINGTHVFKIENHIQNRVKNFL